MQERLTKQIAVAVTKAVQPAGVAVVVEGVYVFLSLKINKNSLNNFVDLALINVRKILQKRTQYYIFISSSFCMLFHSNTFES